MKALLVLLVLLVPALATAEEPTGYAEFPWGTSSGALMQPCTKPAGLHTIVPGMRPVPLPASTPVFFDRGGGRQEMLCNRTIHFGPNDTGWNPRLYLLKGELVGYQILTRTGYYRDLRAIAVDKFGPATTVTVHRLQNRMGVQFTSELMEWRWPSGTVAFLYERFARIDDAALLVETETWARAQDQEQRERIDRGRKAF